MKKIKYSGLKIFNNIDNIYSLPRGVEISAPLHVRIKPTNVCVHNCWYCAYRVDNLQLGKDMSVRDKIPEWKMMEIIEDLVEMKVGAVTFSGGGDPFYYKYLLNTVKRLSETNISFSSLTNGARLNGELAEVFSTYGTWLRVSIDGWDDPSYSKYRGIKEGEYSKVINNLANFKKLNGKCLLGVHLIVDRDNHKHVYDHVSRLHDLGIDNVKISGCIIDNSVEKNNSYHSIIFNNGMSIQ